MKIHIVKEGDTLYALSQKYGVPLSDVIDANPQIKNPDVIHIGDKIKIPTKKTYLAKPSAENKPLEPIKKELEPMKKEQEEKKEVKEHVQKEIKEHVQKEVKELVQKEEKEKVLPKEPFAQFNVPAQPVQSFYDFPKVPNLDDEMDIMPMDGQKETYPGLSGLTEENILAPYGDIPQLDHVHVGGQKIPSYAPISATPNIASPSMYNAQPMMQPFVSNYYLPYGQPYVPPVYPHSVHYHGSGTGTANLSNMPIMPHGSEPMTWDTKAHNVVMPPPMPNEIANAGVHMSPYHMPHSMMPSTVSYPFGTVSASHANQKKREDDFSERSEASSSEEKEEKVQIKARKETSKKKKTQKSRRRKAKIVEHEWKERETSYPWLNI